MAIENRGRQIGGLPERLASELDVRLNTRVKSMSVGKDGIELDIGSGIMTADRVILATPAPVARALHKNPGTIERELLATPYSSTVNIAIAVKESFRIDDDLAEIYGILIPGKERRVIAAISIEGAKEKGRTTNGMLFNIMLSGKAGSEMIGWKEGAILCAVLEEMEKYFAGVSKNILFAKLYRWKEAEPMSPVGRSKKIARYRNSINGSTRVFLAGDYMGMPFTEGAAETGMWAAHALLKNMT